MQRPIQNECFIIEDNPDKTFSIKYCHQDCEDCDQNYIYSVKEQLQFHLFHIQIIITSLLMIRIIH